MRINSTIPYWAPRPPAGTDGHLRECLAVLGNQRQREILQTLMQYGRSLSRADLLKRLVAARWDTPRPTDETAVEISLTHVDLPRLVAARFVATTDESPTVRLLEHPLLADPQVRRLLSGDEVWDNRISVMALTRHRLICAILAEHPNGLPRDRLAALVCVHESPLPADQFPHLADQSPHLADQSPDVLLTDELSIHAARPTMAPTFPLDLSPTAVESIANALHHVHLPALEAVGLVVYDPVVGTVVSSGSDSDAVWQPPDTPASIGTHQYPIDCVTGGVGVRLVVSPDGHVDAAYAYAADDSSVRTVGIPTRSPPQGDSHPLETASRDDPLETTLTPPHREQWLLDCWLRDNVAS